MRSFRAFSNARGAVLAELAFVLPVLLLFLFGILELGRLFSQVSWLANVSYISVLTGGENPPGPQGEIAMNGKFDQLAPLQSQALGSISRTPLYHINDDLVEMSVSTRVKTISPALSLPLALKLVGPMLVLDPTVAGSMNDFDNPSCLYDCNGVKTTCCEPYAGCGTWSCSGGGGAPPFIPPKVLTETLLPEYQFVEAQQGGHEVVEIFP